MQEENRKDSRYNEDVLENRDFIPYKVAKRINTAIQFTVRLEGRCPTLNIDEETKRMLNRFDKVRAKNQDIVTFEKA